MDNEPQLLAAVDAYCRALHTCDTDVLDQVFHPASSLFDVDDGAVRVDAYLEWRRDVAARPSPASVGQSRDDQVVAVAWLSPHCATVHVRIRILGEVFVDHLCLVRDGDRFRVVAKMWHLERLLGPVLDGSPRPV